MPTLLRDQTAHLLLAHSTWPDWQIDGDPFAAVRVGEVFAKIGTENMIIVQIIATLYQSLSRQLTFLMSASQNITTYVSRISS